MRVLFVNHTSTIAGAELVLLDIVRAWRGASAFLFEEGALNDALAERGVAVDVSRYGRGLAGLRRQGGLWAAAPLAGRLCAIVAEIARSARRHDLVYANSQKAFVLAALAATLARRPLVWHLHDIISGAHFGSLQRRLQVGLANRCAARVIVPSKAAADAFISAGGRRDLVNIVANGIDIASDPLPPHALRRELGLPAGPLVGVFSRLAPWKGQHVVIEALAALPGMRCVIAGDALFGEEDYARSLRVLAARRGVEERVIFLGHRSDVPRLMQAVDVMVHPSVDPEPFGRTLVEAMLANVPVIATDTGAARDILESGAAGHLVPPNDPAALAGAIARVFADRARLAPQIAYAATRARTHFGVARMRSAVAETLAAAGGRA